jgi:hypothetical protein
MIQPLPPAQPLYVQDGEHYLPQESTRGPWSVDAQHGGAVAALVAGLLEAHEAERGLEVVRVTVDLLRPVPIRPLRVSITTAHPGRAVDRLRALVVPVGDERPVAAVDALRIRRKGMVPPPPAHEPRPLGTETAPPPPEACPAIDVGFHPWVGLATAGVEMRLAGGAAFVAPGPAAVWFRLLRPVVDEQPVTPLQRACVAADFGNGTSNVAPFADLIYVNPDLTVALHRRPVGEWICLDSVSRLGPQGIGLTESRILDTEGGVGLAVQTLLVASRS